MLGTTEVVVIIAIGLILFGPKKLPEMARSIGRAVGEYQCAVLPGAAAGLLKF